MLSRQYKPSPNDGVEDEHVVPIRRNRSSIYNTGPQLTISDLQKLEELAEEASKSETHALFMPAADNVFKFVPANRWYKFQKRTTRGASSLEEAEKLVSHNCYPIEWEGHWGIQRARRAENKPRHLRRVFDMEE